ncbi:hypothetical protein [Lutibaculum baratangense]|uniref:Tetratricopeptide repeat protein n=1 Tax=Lutibaculum baratangense AMV1 TaxID=631454 RepID=V4RRA8_9HYPH|nr:hypothetical protein [Lutibaculum baratangense]ESR25680.1 hypothetical protein N177_1513 [Lutibaculum baratangense AMV1]
MSAAPISASDAGSDPELRAARAAGWRGCDLAWERLQEEAGAAWREGRQDAAVRAWRRAWRIAFWRLARDDPRFATSLANAALADRLAGREARAARRYERAMALWEKVPIWLEGAEIRPRARSSMFHLRMEARHRDTYRANALARLSRFVEEAQEASRCAWAGEPCPHRLITRWRGEKPSVFDDTRKLLAAALLICVPEGPHADA